MERLVSRGACSYQDLFDSCIADSNTGEVSDYCLTLSWPNMAPVPISEIFPLSSAVFEGSEFPVPRMTDKYLTTMYGEWKKIPEPEIDIPIFLFCLTLGMVKSGLRRIKDMKSLPDEVM